MDDGDWRGNKRSRVAAITAPCIRTTQPSGPDEFGVRAVESAMLETPHHRVSQYALDARPWESLKVNERAPVLVADNGHERRRRSGVDVYDIFAGLPLPAS